jgi:hypothetical protein
MSSRSLKLGKSLKSSLDARLVLQQCTTISEYEVPQAMTPRQSGWHNILKAKKSISPPVMLLFLKLGRK